jgi:hypothetical protein
LPSSSSLSRGRRQAANTEAAAARRFVRIRLVQQRGGSDPAPRIVSSQPF